ncbi:MAG TPA: ABC transporter ATP-binding protein, partial [Chthoniobacteraceae bacterium]|nr:ABC transporter ATP-binding protein [Chthoniobacteraceae bacterium]
MAPNHPQSPAGAPNGREAAPVTEGDVPPQPIVCIRNLRKVRRTSDHQFELVVPAFDVFPGEFVVIIGSSGCGKSTLLDMLGLILACDKGEETFSLGFRDSSYAQVRKLSERSRARLRRRHFGYVLQSGGLLKFLSAKANALLSCRLNGLKNGARAVADLARQVEMEKHLAPRPASLSGGQRQRTAIIRALAHDPEVVLADEPTASLDQLLAAKVLDELQAAARERGTAVIMVTHDSKLVAGKADRVYTFTVETAAPPKGVEDATRSTMLENPDHPARAPWPALNGSAAAGDNGAEAALDDGAEAAVEIDLAGDLDGKPTPAEAAEIAAIDGLVRVQMEMLGEAEGASVQVEDRSGAPLIEEVEGEPANPPEDPHVGTPGEGEIPPAPTPPPAPAPKANARDRHRRSGGPSALFRHIVLMVRLALA